MSKLVKKFEKEKYDKAKEYIEKGKISKGLRYISEDIFILLGKGLSKKEILELINDELGVKIKEQSFYTFCNRVLKNNPISTNTKKSNVKKGKVSHKVSVPKEKKENPNSKKEVQNVKNKLELKKDINTKKDIEKKPGNAVDVLNDDINVANDEYKDLL